MLRFRCPRCGENLRIPEKYFNHVGSCRRCGGRFQAGVLPPRKAWITGVDEADRLICELVAEANHLQASGHFSQDCDGIVTRPNPSQAVLNRAEKYGISYMTPITYTKILPIKVTSEITLPMATPAQVDYLVAMQVPRELAKAATQAEASAWITYLKPIRLECMPVTDSQAGFLKELGVPRHTISDLSIALEASLLIDEMQKLESGADNELADGDAEEEQDEAGALTGITRYSFVAPTPDDIDPDDVVLCEDDPTQVQLDRLLELGLETQDLFSVRSLLDADRLIRTIEEAKEKYGHLGKIDVSFHAGDSPTKDQIEILWGLGFTARQLLNMNRRDATRTIERAKSGEGLEIPDFVVDAGMRIRELPWQP